MKCFTLILALLVSLFPGVILAHVAATDGTLTGVLHIDPGDEAEVGRNSLLQFTLEDTKKNFSIEECDCYVEIKDSTDTLFTSDKTSQHYIGGDQVRVNYTFTHTGPHKVVLRGSDFSLSYDVDVSEVGTGKAMNSVYHVFAHHSSHIIIFGFGFMAAGFIIFKHEKKPSDN